MRLIVGTSIFVFTSLIWLPGSGREVRAQTPTYVGTFAMTNGASIKCLTNSTPGLGASGYIEVTNTWTAVPGQEWAFLRLANGYYAIFNLQTGLFLTGGAGPGSGVVVSTWTADLKQMWYLYPLGGQFYALVNVGNGGVLTDPTTGSQSAIPSLTRPWAATPNQWWYLYFLFE